MSNILIDKRETLQPFFSKPHYLSQVDINEFDTTADVTLIA